MNIVPQRIVCLSAEAADWLWRIGAWESVAGVTAFFTPPAGASAKPRISGFSTAQFEEISIIKPDLVIAFSDVQAALLSELMRRGFPVLGTNQRTLKEIEATLALVGRLVAREAEARKLLTEFREKLAPVDVKLRPRIYFEEWNDPLISGIAWVSELVERAGGEDIFADLRTKSAAADRAVSSEEVCRRNPDIILASWCGRPVRITDIISRTGWNQIAAVRSNLVFEIPSEDILQPGYRVVHGFERMKELFGRRLG
jgi:iron complex transport system substrate-binding protein